MSALGNLIRVAGYMVFIVCGLWGFFLCLGIISKIYGSWGIVAALCLTPVTFVGTPLYAGFKWGNWFPLFLNYGGGITAIVLTSIGNTIRGK
jgi:hypothetical protein